MVIGLTGGIGTGKSAVLQILREMGVKTLSADDIAKEILQPGNDAYNDVLAEFGEEILMSDGSVNKSALAEVIFNDENARNCLNKIMHPKIIKIMEEQVKEFKNNVSRGTFVLEIPLLFECGLEKSVDNIWVVSAEPETQIRRLITRCSIDEGEARKRILAQFPLDYKKSRADIIINNDGSLKELKNSISKICSKLHLP